jgi:hypothetical protein
MIIVTVATHNSGYFNVLQEVLGWGEKWKGFQWRFQLMKEFLKTLPDDEIVVFVDGYDVVALGNEATIRERFLSYKTNILVSIVKNQKTKLHRYMYSRIFPSCENKNISAGLYMGYVKYLKQMYIELCIGFDCSDTKLDDQQMFLNSCLSNNTFFHENIKMDDDSNIFLNVKTKDTFSNVVDLDDPSLFTIDKKQNKILNSSGMEPCFLHGPGEVNLQFVFDLYNYDLRTISERNDSDYKLSHYIKFFIREIVIGIILLFILLYLFYCGGIKRKLFFYIVLIILCIFIYLLT